MPKPTMVEEYHMRQAVAASPEQLAAAAKKRRAREFALRYRGLCGTCRREPLRGPRESTCKGCHAKEQAPRNRRNGRAARQAKEAEAKRLRALARQRKRERANPAYFDWEGAADRTM